MIVVTFVIAAFQSSPAPHPFSIRDMLAMERISDPVVSPDGKRVLFSVRTTDVEANRGRFDLWTCGIDGSDAKPLVAHEANDTNGRWMPNGDVAFLSTRSGSQQAWSVSGSGGDAKQLTDLPVDVENLSVFPDGKRLAFTCEVYPDLKDDPATPANDALAATAARDAERASSKVKARIYTELMFRRWDSWEDGKRGHLFVWTIGGGAPLDVTGAGWTSDVPTKPFGGGEEIAISPDGRELVFACQLATPDMAWTTNVDLYSVPADGSSAPKLLTSHNQASDNAPAFSPDGTKLAWLAMSRPGYESDQQKITVLDRKTNERRVLAPTWDRSPSEIVWDRESKGLYATADHLGQKALFWIGLDGTSRTLVAEGSCGSPRPAGDRVVFLHDTLRSPAELMSVTSSGKDLRALTKLNAAKLAAAKMGDFEQFTFAGWNDETVHAYLVKPIDFDPSKKYPLAFLIHGGPQGSFGNHFHYRWNPQAYAGAGFAAVMVDFHGSTGYGQAFTDAIRGDWGGKPLEDLVKGLEAALARYPFLDGKRVAALGASYGGYMINWIAGQEPDRFRCLVNHDGNLDERLAYYDTEELWFPEWEHGGTPWENPQGFEKHNPIDHVGKWKTPMLVIHGALDYRVVDTQGMSTFTALRRRGIPAKFLHFPDENHWVLKPQNSILWHETVLEWITRWTR